MSNYNQGAVSGDAWTRAYEVRINNPLVGPKYATFNEERVFVLGDEKVHRPEGSCRLTMDEETAGTPFNLIHPETGLVIGQSTYAQAYVMLHSLYMHAAAERDNAPVPA